MEVVKYQGSSIQEAEGGRRRAEGGEQWGEVW